MFCHYMSCFIQLQALKYINSIINCNIVPYSYFPHGLSLHILYIQLQTLKYIECVINSNIFQHSHFPHVLLIPVTTSLKRLRWLRAANAFLRGCMSVSSAVNHRHLCTKPHDITTHKTVNVTSLAMSISNLTIMQLFSPKTKTSNCNA